MSSPILIDKNSMQIFGHFEKLIYNGYGTKIEPNPNYNKRLGTFLGILESLAKDVIVDFVTKENLEKCDCLVSLTRIRPYEEKEILSILDYLKEPKSRFLLMSNHNPDQLYDDVLASSFGISLTGGYWSGTRGNYIEIEENYFTDHKIIAGLNRIITNTTSRVVSSYGTPIVYLPDCVVGRWSSLNEEFNKNKVFALAVDGKIDLNDYIKGKVIITGDSGFLGDHGSTFPGFGIIDKGDNVNFAKNMINWLLEK